MWNFAEISEKEYSILRTCAMYMRAKMKAG